MKATPAQADRLHRFAHDLRNRLAALQQALGQLGAAPGAEGAALRTFAEQQVFKALRHTEELLDDLGVERGIGNLRPAHIALRELVRAEAEHLRHRLERKGQALGTDLEDARAMADPEWAARAVSALLSNASKFGHHGQPIHVSLKAEGGYAVLTVTDAGIGLDQEDLAAVFTRYAWLKGAPTAGEAQGRGTLARMRQWAEASGGSLSARSEGPGKGASFTLRLPLA
ncbi:MAG: sensor histidine kinase [Flavobacteriales bacterium]